MAKVFLPHASDHGGAHAIGALQVAGNAGFDIHMHEVNHFDLGTPLDQLADAEFVFGVDIGVVNEHMLAVF
jgi:hypothetical protein